MSENFSTTSKADQYTTSNGAPYSVPHGSQQLRIGQNSVGGHLLLQDTHLIESLAHFHRERIPERVVHARGAGAHGHFQSTADVTWLCAADFLGKGTESPVTVRFSTNTGEAGSADTVRDARGFAIKLRTTEGVLDWVFNTTPVFPIRDPAKFPNFNHSQKRDPQTNLHSPVNSWDFFSSNPETLHQLMITMGDRGVPRSHTNQNAYSVHTFKFVNANGQWHYVKIHAVSDQGLHYYTQEEAEKLAGTNANVLAEELYKRIEQKKYPSWTVSVQVMTEHQAKEFEHSIFDTTKVWPLKDYPRQIIGKIILDENPRNYFAEIEQVAFSPSNLVPGIEPSADPVLQSRLFAYPDAQRYRLGVNYLQIPVNAPLNPTANFQRDGFMTINGNQNNRPNYPSTIRPLQYTHINPASTYSVKHQILDSAAEIDTFLSTFDPIKDTMQPRDLYVRIFDEAAKKRFIDNIAGSLGACTDVEIVKRQLRVFRMVHDDIADRLAAKLGISDKA